MEPPTPPLVNRSTGVVTPMISDTCWEHSAGRRLALLINEFGSLGIDREIIGGCGIPTCREEDVIELANGCICCTVADDFLPAMSTILARAPAPEHIII